jgi:SAM-dependent methyltransferase
MEIRSKDWGQQEWQAAHFPDDQLDTVGDSWGFRWRGVEKWRHGRCLELLKPLLRRQEPLDILDIGCALCDFTVKLSRLNSKNRISGFDIVPAAVSWGKRKFPEFDLRQGSLPEIPFDRSFDIILCMEVLCYIDGEDRRRAIQNIREALVPGGQLVFSGVLDGGARHHTLEELLQMIEGHFRVDRIMYNHWAWYKRLMELPLDSADTRLAMIAGRLDMAEQEFQDWFVSRGGMFPRVIRLLRVIRPAAEAGIRVLRWFSRVMRSWALPPRAGHWLSALTRSSKRADEIVIVATRT